MFFYLSFFWFIRETRACLFWLYLWQLKEYHIGRFLDHFRTEKGKRLFFNKLLILKIILFFYALFLALPQKTLPWFFYAVWIVILITAYFFESIKAIFDFFRKRLKKPVLTKKASFLVSVIIIFEIFFIFLLFQNIKLLYWSSFFFLVFDILTPLLVSTIILLFQPLTVLLRNRIIKKAKIKREKFENLIVIGIVGSYGKTSTKEFLTTILAEKFGENKVLKTKENQNSEIGIAQCILNDLKPEHKIFVCEIGAYNKGKIKEVCQFLKPKIAILTGVNEQHLATFGSMDNLLSAEGGKELIESLPEDGLVVFNGNNKYCREIYQETKIKKRIIFNDFWAEEIKTEKEWIEFKVFSKDGDSADLKVNLLGAQNIENILLAACCAKELGMNLQEISRAVAKIKPQQSGIQLFKGLNGINIINATYSANPNGVLAHLEYLNIWPARKIIIMPCLIELGRVTIEIHKKIGQKIAEVCDLGIITTKDRFKEIKEIAGGKVIFSENPKKIFEKIKTFCRAGDTILLEGRLPDELIKQLTINNDS